MNFLQDSIDLFKGRKTSHMGAHQYVPHTGMRHGKSTSGDKLWAETEAQHNVSSKAMFNAETVLLRQAASKINQFIPQGLPVVDLGPGTVQAFRNKVLPLMQAIRSEKYIPVDESIVFLQDLFHEEKVRNHYSIRPLIDNFFENESPYHDGSALVCSFGSTISNIENAISNDLPEESLIKGLYRLASAANDGALLVAFDSNQNGESIKDYYRLHALFQLNIFDRMAVELSMKDFDALVFDYEPVWIPASGQLAHTAIATRNTDFEIGGNSIHLEKGQRLHLKNSYKFQTAFFEQACHALQLDILRVWEDDSTSKVYLLRLPPYAASKKLVMPSYSYTERAVA